MHRLLLLAVLISIVPALHARGAEPRELWLYYPTNLLVDKNLDKIDDIWGRAAKAGYTHVLLTDSKFSKLGEMNEHYFANVERCRKTAKRLNLTLRPAMFSVGYSNDLLWNNPDLVEGLPVKDQEFESKGGRLVSSPATPVKFAKIGFKDENVSVDRDTATVFPGGNASARFTFKLNVPQFRCYHVSVKIKTADYHGHPEIKALAGKRSLQWENLGVKPMQDWTEHHVVFNSLDNAEVTVYFGDWSHPDKGSLWWKDWKIEESPLVNIIRRTGTPVTITTPEGKPIEEGKDIDQIFDPKMGRVPWAGEFNSWHEPPIVKTRLKEGTRVRVSWYHPAIVYDGQVCACVADGSGFGEVLATQARHMKETFGAGGYMMSHDEFRVFGWDESCRQTGKTPGENLAANVRLCRELLRTSRVYVWSDMFDPHHNAVPGPYYLVNGPWTNSWEGLDKDVVIVNWNYGKRDESLKFFADRGHKQLIAGYYDGGQSTSKWIESANKVQGVVGIMYTTWKQDFSKIESFAAEVMGK